MTSGMKNRGRAENLLNTFELAKQYEEQCSILKVYVEKTDQLDSKKCMEAFSFLKNSTEKVFSIRVVQSSVEFFQEHEDSLTLKYRSILGKCLQHYNKAELTNILLFYDSFGALTEEIRQFINKKLEILIKKQFFSEFVVGLLNQIDSYNDGNIEEMRKMVEKVFKSVSEVSSQVYLLGGLLKRTFNKEGQCLEKVMDENGYPNIFDLFVSQLKKTLEYAFGLLQQNKNKKAYEYFLSDYFGVNRIFERFSKSFGLEKLEITSYKEDFERRVEANLVESTESVVYFINSNDNRQMAIKYSLGYFSKLKKVLDSEERVDKCLNQVFSAVESCTDKLFAKIFNRLIGRLFPKYKSKEIDRSALLEYFNLTREAFLSKDEDNIRACREWTERQVQTAERLLENNTKLVEQAIGDLRENCEKCTRLLEYIVKRRELPKGMVSEEWVEVADKDLRSFLTARNLKIDAFLRIGANISWSEQEHL